MRIANDRDLYTVAHLAVQFQQAFPTMRKALDLIHAEPELSLNGVGYFSLDDARVELLREYFDTRRVNSENNKGAKWTNSLPNPEGFQRVNIPKAVPADSSVDGGSAGVDAD